MSVIRNILNSTKLLVNNSLPTTGSNTFRGTQTLSGSILPATDNVYDLGSATYQWKDIYVSSGSLYIDGTKVLSSTNQELQITTDNGQSIKILEAGSDSIILQTADGDIQLKTSGGGNLLFDPTTGLIDVRGTLQIQDGNKITSSGGNSIQFGNDLGITGSLSTTGNINGINLSTFSSSVASTFLNQNTATSSYETKGRGLVSGSSQITFNEISSLPTLVSGSSQITISSTNGFTTYSSSVDSRILTEKGRVDAILLASDADKDSFAEIVSLINAVDTSNDSTFASFYTGSTNRLNSLESTSGSVNTSVSNLNTFSSSVETKNSTLATYTGSVNSQLTSLITATSSYETRGRSIVSGSSQITFSGISSLPTLVSGSSQITISSTSGYGSVLNQAVLTSSSPTFAGLTINGKVTATSTGVDGTFADAFVSQYSVTNAETNAIQTSVSSAANVSGFRFQVSNGGLSSARTTVVDFLRDRAIFNTSIGIGTSSPRTAATGGNKTLDIKGGIYFGSTNSESTCINNDDSFIINFDSNNDGGTANFLRIAKGTTGETGGTELLRVNGSGHVLPGANGTQDLGSTSLRWGTVYTSDLSLNNGIGDWTIVEGEDDLFLYNNKKGKVYKFALTEVDPNVATPKKS
jgi:hypothetical protein